MSKYLWCVRQQSTQITVFCDLSKAFDTISHNILFSKLHTYGIRGKANDFLKSYLSFWKQFTVYSNTSSTYKHINYGVSQGSILGLILFLVYANDIVCTSNKIKFLLYPDDTPIYIKGKYFDEMISTLKNEVIKVSDWISSNKLTMNVSKIFYMVSSLTNINEGNMDVKLKTTICWIKLITQKFQE